MSIKRKEKIVPSNSELVVMNLITPVIRKKILEFPHFYYLFFLMIIRIYSKEENN